MQPEHGPILIIVTPRNGFDFEDGYTRPSIPGIKAFVCSRSTLHRCFMRNNWLFVSKFGCRASVLGVFSDPFSGKIKNAQRKPPLNHLLEPGHLCDPVALTQCSGLQHQAPGSRNGISSKAVSNKAFPVCRRRLFHDREARE